MDWTLICTEFVDEILLARAIVVGLSFSKELLCDIYRHFPTFIKINIFNIMSTKSELEKYILSRKVETS